LRFTTTGESTISFAAAHAGEAVFNEAYRYVDWLLTVPLLLLETIAVLALPAANRKALIARLVPASACDDRTWLPR